MSKGLALRRHEQKKAKARAKAHFSALYDTKWWDTPKVIGKRAETSAVCGRSGCMSCSRRSLFSYTKAWKDAKVTFLED